MNLLNCYITRCISCSDGKRVYEALNLGRRVIIEFYTDQDLAYRETLALNVLEKYKITPTFIDNGRWNGLYYIITKKIEGYPLSKLNITKELAKKLGRTIAIMHNAKVHHGDLHKGNILIDLKGNIVILDFEFSIIFSERSINSKYIECIVSDLLSLMWDFPGRYILSLLEGYFYTIDSSLKEEITSHLMKIASKEMISASRSLDELLAIVAS